MKEATRHPHILDLDERLKTFSGDMSDGSYPLRPPSYFTDELIGYKLIGSQSFKDQVTKQDILFCVSVEYSRFFSLQSFRAIDLMSPKKPVGTRTQTFY